MDYKSALFIVIISLAIMGITKNASLAGNNATSVALAGSLQTELGCSADWNPACANTELSLIGNHVWRQQFTIPFGNWQYKITLNDAWNF